MDTEQGNGAERLLEDTKLPACDVLWLRAGNIRTLQQLSALSLEEIEQLPGFQHCLLAPICLLGLVEGVQIGGMTQDEMKRCAESIIGHPVTPETTLQRLEFYSGRCELIYRDVAVVLQ